MPIRKKRTTNGRPYNPIRGGCDGNSLSHGYRRASSLAAKRPPFVTCGDISPAKRGNHPLSGEVSKAQTLRFFALPFIIGCVIIMLYEFLEVCYENTLYLLFCGSVLQ